MACYTSIRRRKLGTLYHNLFLFFRPVINRRGSIAAPPEGGLKPASAGVVLKPGQFMAG
jgi:hypothetical protein